MPNLTTVDGRLTVCVIGTIGARRGNRELRVTAPGERRVLARLAVALGESVTSSKLIDALWPETPPSTATQSLQNTVSRLRSNLGSGAIISTVSGYRLATPDVDVDINALARLVEELDNDSHSADVLVEAAEYARGEPFAELTDESWVRSVALQVREQQLLIRERILRSALQAGRAVDSVPIAQELCADEPLRESAAILLMQALDETGRVADAVRVAATFRLRTVHETGLEPSPRIFSFERELLQREPVDRPHDSPRSMQLPPQPPRPIIGRSGDLATLTPLLGGSRVVTLWGPGGVGKTRLAVALAEELALTFRDGTVFVDLGAVNSAGEVNEAFANACAASIGLAGAFEAVVSALADRQMLLIADCCEGVLERVASLVSALVERCPGLTILATSRERMQLDVEDAYYLRCTGCGNVPVDSADRGDSRFDCFARTKVPAVGHR